MKKQLLLAVTAAALIGVSGSSYALFGSSSSKTTAAQPMRIGVVDYLKVFQNVPQGQATLNKLKASLKPSVLKLKSSQQALSADIKKLEKNGPTLSKAQRAEQEKALNKKQQAFHQQVSALRTKEMGKQQAAAKVFEGDLKKAVAEVAQKHHFDMLITKQAVPYVNSKFNVTQAVIDDMKKMGS